MEEYGPMNGDRRSFYHVADVDKAILNMNARIAELEKALRWVLDNSAMIDYGNDWLATPRDVDAFERLKVPEDVQSVVNVLMERKT
jgi:hypothetical protein